MFRLDMVEHPLKIGLDEAPRSHILRLFLAPHHLGFRKSAELLNQGPRRERVELLDAQEIDVVDVPLLALLVEVVLDLAGAEHHALDLGVGLELDRLAFEELGIVPQHPVKARPGTEL